VGIPCLQEFQAVLDNEEPYTIQLMNTETTRFRKPDRLQPKLGNAVAVLDVNVRRLRSFETVEEEAKSMNPQDRRHRDLFTGFANGIQGDRAGY
jgi:hypothetical protein